MPMCAVCGSFHPSLQAFRMVCLDDGTWVSQCRECEAKGDTAPTFVRDLERSILENEPEDEDAVWNIDKEFGTNTPQSSSHPVAEGLEKLLDAKMPSHTKADRKWKRKASKLKASFSVGEDETLKTGNVVDVSRSGCKLQTEIDLQKDVELHLVLEGKIIKGVVTQLIVDGVVVRRYVKQPPFEVGVKFLSEAVVQQVTRRKEPRKDIEIPVTYRLPWSETWYKGVLKDLSREGASIQGAEEVRINDAIVVDILAAPNTPPMRKTITITHSHRGEAGFIFGGRFEHD